MSIILAEWTPKKITNLPDEQPGDVVTGERWQELWKLVIEQGDYNSDTIALLLQHYFDFVNDTEAALLTKRDTTVVLDHNNIADITGTDAANCHPISAITGLQTILDNISAGAVSAFAHNDIGSRDAADAHPIASITGLEAQLTALAEPKTTADITHAPAQTLAQKLAAMDSTIALLSGGIEVLEHNDLTARTAADAHPMSAITGLVTTLAGKQTKITYGTADPTGGSDGDVYIKYA